MAITIREEEIGDRHAVFEVNQAAFGGDAESKLVDALRSGGFVRISLVAVQDGRIVGHILFSDLPIHTASGIVPALALAPMAVVPELQRQGIGTMLAKHGMEMCRDRGHRIVVVVGHRDFYPRFGFSNRLAANLDTPYPGESFMAAELVPGALTGVAGRVVYPPPFQDL